MGLLATSGDITSTWTSPVYPKLYSNDSSINPLGRPITEDEDGWIGSLVYVGATLGPLPFGLIAEHCGKKIALLLIGIPHVIGYITMAFARNIYLFYFGRLIGGLAMGAGYALSSLYVAEIAEHSKRGMHSVTLGVFWCFGNFLPYAIGPFLSIMYFNLIVASIPVLFCVSFGIFATESPYYLVGINQDEKARQVLMLLRSRETHEVEEELKHIKNVVKNEQHGHFSDIIRNLGLRKAFIISEVMVIFQQFSGMNAIAFYQQPIYKESGSKISPEISSAVTGVVVLVCSFIMPVIIDKYYRKTLFVFSATATSITLAAMGTFFYLKENTHVDTKPIFWLPITSILIYNLAMGFGFNILPWTISSELFPKNVKQLAASTLSSTSFIAAFIITKFFNNLRDCLGIGGSFWLFSGVCAIAAVFGIIWIPETRGKDFLQIQAMLQR